MLSKNQILEVLSDAINFADDKRNFELGDQLLEVIAILKQEWNMEEE